MIPPWLRFWSKPPRARHVVLPPQPKFLLTQACLDALPAALAAEMRLGHEGIVYLLGRSDGVVSLATTVFKPDAFTTPGSFHVEPRAMAACVSAAGQFELQVVAQLHTHPGSAFHSDGDVEGARIRFPGYVSIVLPDYGRLLPRMDGAAVYMWSATGNWLQLASTDVIVIPGAGPWTARTGTTSGTTARSATPGVA